MNNNINNFELYNIYKTYEIRQIVSLGIDFLTEFLKNFKNIIFKTHHDNFKNEKHEVDNNFLNFLNGNNNDLSENLKMILIHQGDIYKILKLKNKTFLTWIHEFKIVRNKYSHNESFFFRDIIRFFDYIMQTLEYFSFNELNDIFQKSLLIYKVYIEKMNDQLKLHFQF